MTYEHDSRHAIDGNAYRAALIAAGVLRPNPDPNAGFRAGDMASGVPTPETPRAVPCLTLDQIGKTEGARDIADQRRGIRPRLPRWMRDE